MQQELHLVSVLELVFLEKYFRGEGGMREVIKNLILGFIGSFIAIYGFAVVQDTPRKYLIRAALVGGVSGLAYWIAIVMGTSDVLASFFSALTAGIISHIFARVYKVPVTLFLVAGILPTVPGAGMYRTVSSFISANNSNTMYYLTQTLETAGVIALAIFVVDSLFSVSQKHVVLVDKEEQQVNENGKS